MFRVNVVGDGGLNKTEGGREEGRKGKERFVQDRYGWRRGPEHHGGREGRKEGKGGKDLFRIGVVGSRSLNKTEGSHIAAGLLHNRCIPCAV